MLEEYDWCAGGGAKASIGVFDAADVDEAGRGCIMGVGHLRRFLWMKRFEVRPRACGRGRKTGALCSSDRLAQRSEGGAKLFREQFWLLPSREMSAFVDFVPVDELLEGLLSPAARSAVDLPGEDCHRNRHLRNLNCVERPAPSLRGVSVGPRRGGAGV